MVFEKYNDRQLKTFKRVLLALAITMLVVMCLALGYGIHESSKGEKSNILFLVPTVFGPLTFIPIILSTMVESERKKRAKK